MRASTAAWAPRTSTSRSSRCRRRKRGRAIGSFRRDGGIFTFGDARFYGSTGSLVLAQPIAGITTSPSGKGYQMVAKDGGVFNFGDSQYYGSLPTRGIHVDDVAGAAPTPSSTGYWVTAQPGRDRTRSATRTRYVPLPDLRARSRRRDLLEPQDTGVPARHTLGRDHSLRRRAGRDAAHWEASPMPAGQPTHDVAGRVQPASKVA